MPTRPSKPRDVNQRAYATMLEATGQAPPEDAVPAEPQKNPHAVALGKLGGAKGGHARAATLSKKRKTEIARRGAAARWSKPK